MVCRDFILPESANYVSFYPSSFLRNLSYLITKQRPDWDLGLLEGLGYVNICTERDITEELWDEKEQLLYGNTPMFMIRAEKP